MNYELYMSAALAEARAAAEAGEAVDGAVAVLDEALVASARCQVVASGDPTAHSVLTVVRETARRLGRSHLRGVIIFTAVEPCAMCVGALLEADADGLVYAMPNAEGGAAGSCIQLASGESLPRRLEVVSGIMQREAAELDALVRRPYGSPAGRA